MTWAEDFCNSEVFSPRCDSKDDVIVMRNATYGRMRIAKCVKQDYGFVGCGNDVMAVLESRCSGRRSCDVRVSDPVFDEFGCNPELKSYLSADFTCVTGKENSSTFRSS